MSETPTPQPPLETTGSYYSIGTSNATTVDTTTVTGRSFDPAMCVNSDSIAKTEKRKADHAHNLRLQKARKHGGKMKPW